MKVSILMPLCLLLVLSGCTTLLKPVPPNPRTGLFPAFKNSHGVPISARIVVSKKTDLSRYHDNLLVTAGSFWVHEVRYIGVFRHVFNASQLRKEIIRAGLQQRLHKVTGLLALNKIYRDFKPFLWLHIKIGDNSAGHTYFDLVVTDPKSAQNLFVARRILPHMQAAVSDQSLFYPMMNAFVKWIHQDQGISVKVQPPAKR